MMVVMLFHPVTNIKNLLHAHQAPTNLQLSTWASNHFARWHVHALPPPPFTPYLMCDEGRVNDAHIKGALQL